MVQLRNDEPQEMNGPITQMQIFPRILVTLILITIGIGLKLFITPSLQWTPDAREGV